MIKGRVKETSVTTGTGTLNLDGAVSGFRTFLSAFGTGKPCYYVIVDGTAWEVGLGTITSGSPNTLSRDVVTDSSASGSKLTLSSGTKTVFNDVPADATLPSVGRDNYLINGDLAHWRRGTSFASPAVQTYVADRWKFNGVLGAFAGVATWSQHADVPSLAECGTLLPSSLSIDCTSADSTMPVGSWLNVEQPVEGYNWRELAQRVISISLWLKFVNNSGSIYLNVRNSGGDRSYTALCFIAASNVWQRFPIQIPASPSAGTWDYANGAGLIVGVCLGAGTTFQTTAGVWQTGDFRAGGASNLLNNTANELRIAGLKLEPGGAATPIRVPLFQVGLDLCKRYYQKSFDYGTTPVQNVGTLAGAYIFMAGKAGALAENGAVISSPIPMRTTAPTTIFFNPSVANAQARDVTAAADCTATAVAANGESSFAVTATGAAGTAVGNQLAVHWTRSAEL